MRTCLTTAILAVFVALALSARGAAVQPEAKLELRIQQPDSKPAAGAQVVVFGFGQTAYVRDAKFEHVLQVEPVTADDGGVVTLPPLKDQHRLVVAHEAGFALVTSPEVEALADQVVKLQPYGRIEGRLMIGESPAPEGSIVTFRHYPQDQQLMQSLCVDNHATTDAEGRFALEHVWPGAGLLTHVKMTEQGGVHTMLNLICVPTTVAADETTRAQFGGSGRPVIGKVVLPERARGWMVLATLVPQRKMPEPPWPEEAAGWTQQQKNEFRGKWMTSPDGQAAIQAISDAALRPQPSWDFEVDREGRLSTNDVEPGQYQLLISAMDPGLTGQTISQHRNVVIPEPDAASPRQPHDLREIDL